MNAARAVVPVVGADLNTRTLLASPLGFLIGLSLGALGGGGSSLAIPILVFVAGQEPSAATTTSLLVVGSAALIGAAGHWRRGRVRLGAGVLFGLIGVAGSLVGSAINRHLDGHVLLLAFSGVMLVAAWRLGAAGPGRTGVEPSADLGIEREAGSVRTHTATSTWVRYALLAATGTAVGFLTGLFGVGGGFVIVPALVLVLRYPMPDAVGTSLVIITINSAVAFAARLGGSIDWGTTLPFAVGAMFGVSVGTRIAGRIRPEETRRWFALLLAAVAIYTGARAAAGVW